MEAIAKDLENRVTSLEGRVQPSTYSPQNTYFISPTNITEKIVEGMIWADYWSAFNSYKEKELVKYNKHLYIATTSIAAAATPGLIAVKNFEAQKFFIPSVASITPVGFYYESKELAEGLWTKANQQAQLEFEKIFPHEAPSIQLWQFYLHRENEAEQVRFEPIFFNFNGEAIGESTEKKREEPGGNVQTYIFNDEYNVAGAVGTFFGQKRQQQKELVFFDVRWGSAKLTKAFVMAVEGGYVERPAPHKGEFTMDLPQAYGFEMTSTHIVEPPEGNKPPSKDPRWQLVL